MSRFWPLISLTLLHTLVDTFATISEPLWPTLMEQYHYTPGGFALVLAVASLTPSFVQPFFGWLRDRQGTRYTLWIGPVIAVATLPFVGVATDWAASCLMFFIGMVGVGAFHPEAAVTAGQLWPEHRTRGLSIFMFGGTLGLGIAPILSGYLVQHHGLAGLRVMVLPGAVLALFLYITAFRGSSSRTATTHRAVTGDTKTPLRLRLALGLLIVGGLRVVPNIGMTKAIAFTLAARGADTQEIGNTQSIFLIFGSLGMLALASRFPRGWERLSLIVCPLVCAPLVLALAFGADQPWVTYALLAISGLLLHGTTPALVSYGHQLFPNGAGLASALTMGAAWGVGGVIVAQLVGVYGQSANPEWLYAAFVPTMFLASAGAWLLPQPAAGHA